MICGKTLIEDFELKSDLKEVFSECEEVLGILSQIYCAYSSLFMSAQ